MYRIYMPDVGDGLALGIGGAFSGLDMQIDCGSQQDPRAAYTEGIGAIKPKVFVLSHFHVDHYNGLLARLPHDFLYPVREVYFPRIPEFADRERFAMCLFTMNLRVLGDVTGNMPADLLNVLSESNAYEFRYRALSAGDTFDIQGSRFTVLWPPPKMERKTALKSIERAISDFEEAVRLDDDTKRLYGIVGDLGTVRPYLEAGADWRELESRRQSFRPHFNRRNEQQMPEVVQRANKSLRKAANRLSLALRQDNRLLFLGDLEAHELSRTVAHLDEQGCTDFYILVTPHHGTHWSKNMLRLHARIALSSVGARLFKYSKPEYKVIAKQHLITHLQGHIGIPSVYPWER